MPAIKGTTKLDTLNGTALADRISGLAGNDVLNHFLLPTPKTLQAELG
jgi:Ca2+-binding RTX toxin-like protein